MLTESERLKNLITCIFSGLLVPNLIMTFVTCIGGSFESSPFTPNQIIGANIAGGLIGIAVGLKKDTTPNV